MKQKKTWQSYMSPTILARWHKESKNCPQEKFNNSRFIAIFGSGLRVRYMSTKKDRQL